MLFSRVKESRLEKSIDYECNSTWLNHALAVEDVPGLVCMANSLGLREL